MTDQTSTESITQTNVAGHTCYLQVRVPEVISLPFVHTSYPSSRARPVPLQAPHKFRDLALDGCGLNITIKPMGTTSVSHSGI
jgi:hypothetical protein